MNTGNDLPYSYGNFRIQFSDKGFTIGFDPNVTLQQQQNCSVISRTPIVMLSKQRIFQLEVFHVQDKYNEQQDTFFDIIENQDDITLVINDFQEPSEVPQLTPELSAELQQNASQFEYTTLPGLKEMTQISMNPKYSIYKQTDGKTGFRYKYLMINLFLSFPPPNCKQIYYIHSVNYVLRADIAVKSLIYQYPINDYITQEFSYIMFKPFYEQCCRVVQFDHQGKPLYNDFNQEKQQEANEYEKKILQQKIQQVHELISQQQAEIQKIEEMRQQEINKLEAKQQMYESISNKENLSQSQLISLQTQLAKIQTQQQTKPDNLSVNDIENQTQINHFSVHLNDFFVIMNKELNPSKILVYQYTSIEEDKIASAKRLERQTACFMRNYLIMNEFINKYSWYLIEKGQLNDSIPLFIALQPVLSKLTIEVYSKFTKLDKTKTIFWDYDNNFMNTYIQFFDSEGAQIVDILEQLNRMNKVFELRNERRMNRRIVTQPEHIVCLSMIDMDYFFQQVADQIKNGRVKDENTKMFGTDKILLEPYYQNTYISCRLSFPYFKFNHQTCQFLTSVGNNMRSGKQLHSGILTIDTQPGKIYHLRQLDQLAEDIENGDIIDLKKNDRFRDISCNITAAEGEALVSIFEQASAIKGGQQYFNDNYAQQILQTRSAYFPNQLPDTLTPDEYYVQQIASQYTDDIQSAIQLSTANCLSVLNSRYLRNGELKAHCQTITFDNIQDIKTLAKNAVLDNDSAQQETSQSIQQTPVTKRGRPRKVVQEQSSNKIKTNTDTTATLKESSSSSYDMTETEESEVSLYSDSSSEEEDSSSSDE